MQRPRSFYGAVLSAPLALLAALALGTLAWVSLEPVHHEVSWEMLVVFCLPVFAGLYVGCVVGLLLVLEFLRATWGVSRRSVASAGAVSSILVGLAVALPSQELGVAGTLGVFTGAVTAIATLLSSWWCLSAAWRWTQNDG